MRAPNKSKPFSTLEKSLFLVPVLIIAVFYVWRTISSNSIGLLSKPDRELRGGPGRVNNLLFSPDGKRLVSQKWMVKQQRGYLELWDVENSKLLRTLPNAYGYPFAAFSRDSSILEIKEGNTAFTSWDATTGEVRSERPQFRPSLIQPDSPVSVSDVSIYGTKAVSKNREVVELRDIRSDKLKFRLYHPQKKERFFKMTPDGTMVLTFSDFYNSDSNYTDTLTLWDARTGKGKMSMTVESLSSISFLNNKVAIIQSRYKVILLDCHSGEIIDSLQNPPNTFPQIEQSSDGRMLAVTFSGFSDYDERPAHVFLWDTRTKNKSGPLSLPLSSYKNYVSTTVNYYWSGFSRDGVTFFIGKQTGLVKFYDAKNGKQQHIIRLRGVQFENINGYFHLSPDNTLLGGSGMVVDKMNKKPILFFYLWDTKSGKLLKRVFAESSSFRANYFSPDAKWLSAPQEDGSIQLWNIAKIKSKSS